MLDIVKDWHQKKLNSSLKKACMLGNYKMAIMIIHAGANNFEQCIKECAQRNRLNHILAYLRLCQAAYEDDETAVELLLESNEEKASSHPRYPSLADFNEILRPLIDNGTLTIAEPLHVALRASHKSIAGKILYRVLRQSIPTLIDWHGLELKELEKEWLKSDYFPNLQLLCLSVNSLTVVPSLASFTSLVKLQIAFNKLTFVPSTIFQMPSLVNIDLSYNQISCLPEALLGHISSSLSILTLSHNQLNSFPAYFSDSRLTSLDLSRNRFKEVPDTICSIKTLECLNMSHNSEIRFIPYELGGLKQLKVPSFDGLPYTFNIPNDSLIEFLRKRFKTMKTVSHCEVVLVGFPDHLHVLESVYTVIKGSELDCSLLKFDSPMQFLTLHSIFQQPNSLYVVPWDSESRQDANDLHRILRHLSIHAPDAPICVVPCWRKFTEDKEEEVRQKIEISMWYDLQEYIRVVHLVMESLNSSGEETGGSYSSQSFVETIFELVEQFKLSEFIPGSYYECERALAHKRKVLQSDNKCPLVGEDEFWEEVSSMPSFDLSSKDELPKLVEYLSSAGAVVHIQGPTGIKSCYAINRQWLCSTLGNVVWRRGTQVGRSFTAMVHKEGLIDLLNSPCLCLPLPEALQYMLNKEALAMAVSSQKWLIPSMLMDHHDNLTHIDPEQYGIRRQYTLSLVPATFWCRLITHLLMNMENFVREVSAVDFSRADKSNHRADTLPRQGIAVDWSYCTRGIICWQNACHLVYSIESIPAYSDPFQETIEIRVPNNIIGYRVMHRLSLLIDTMLKNWYPKIWSSVEIWVPCSYCIHTGIPNVPSILFQDCLLAAAKEVGVKCLQHPEKIVDIARIIPDLVHESVSQDVFLPPGSVEFNTSDTSSCISPPPYETVYKGKFNDNLVAVKPFVDSYSIKKGTLSQFPPLQTMWAEFEIFRHIRNANCPFIINILGLCPDPFCLVFPFARWSSLDDVFRTKDITLPHLVRLKMVYQVASALDIIQAYKVIHRNLCLANLLVFSLSSDDEVNVKLAGFSNACYAVNQGLSVGQYGMFPAPEMLNSSEGEYDERVDIFAFAFVMYEIITQKRMHVTSNIPLSKHSSVSRPSLEAIQKRAPYLVQIISKCWNPDRTKRPFASELIRQMKDPLTVLASNGKQVEKSHEFFAAAAKFTRMHNSFHSDVFVCSGQLMEPRTMYLSRVSVPGLLQFDAFKALPNDYIICMGCIGSQIWICYSTYKVQVYSCTTLEFINEFMFKHLVVAISVSPTSVYLGLENGVLQIFDVTNSVPTEPTTTKIVCSGEEFKCLEALEDSVICATKNTVYFLHPDTLEREGKWELYPNKEVRSVVVSTTEDGEVEGNQLLWIAFRRWEEMIIMNPITGKHYYNIDCSKVVNRPSSKVYVQSLRAVLDTVWVGLNTGHILMFASSHRQPHLLTHLKVHQQDVRQLLLLHPSYMGPATVQSTSEITEKLRQLGSGSVMDTSKQHTHRYIYPDSVQVVSFGTGLEHSLCEVDCHGNMNDKKEVQDGEEGAPCCSSGLHAVVLEGINAKRTVQVEENSGRTPLLHMNGYVGKVAVDEEKDGDDLYDVPRNVVPQTPYIPRFDTWSARTAVSPVHSNLKNTKNQYNIVRLATEKNKPSRIIEEEEPVCPTNLPPRYPPKLPPKSDSKPPLPPRPGRASPKSNGNQVVYGKFTCESCLSVV